MKTAIRLLLLAHYLMTMSEAIADDTRVLLDVPGLEPVSAIGWADSYSVGNSCYCDNVTTYDHEIGTFYVETPLGWMTIRQVCELLGPGPGMEGRPLYNDVQCGNGPPNDAGDEHKCPGRVDLGIEGCGHIGPKWDFSPFLNMEPSDSPTFSPITIPVSTPEPTISPPTEPGGFYYEPVFLTHFGSNSAVNGYSPPDELRLEGSINNFGGGSVEINMTDADEAYSGHSWSFDYVAYRLNLDSHLKYEVTVGFAETYIPNCGIGRRIFNLKVGSHNHDNIDVFNEVGCQTAFNIIFSEVQPEPSGELVVNVTNAGKDNPFISVLEIRGMSPWAPPEPSVGPSANPTSFPTLVPSTIPTQSEVASAAPSRTSSQSAQGSSLVKVHFGTDNEADGYTAPNYGAVTTGDQIFLSSGGSSEIGGTDEDEVYRSHIWSFTYLAYTITALEPSAFYDVRLGWAETHAPNCNEGKRLFNVKVGDKPMVEDVDVWKEAGGCWEAYDMTFAAVQSSAIGILVVNVTKGQVENPFLSLLEVKSVSDSGTTSSPTGLATLQPSVSPTSSGGIVARVNFGSNQLIQGYDMPEPDQLTGVPGVVKYPGAGQQINQPSDFLVYESHVWSFENLTYTLNVDPSREYDVKIMLAESYTPNCFNDRRIFHLKVGNQLKENIDVFREVGCQTALDLKFFTVKPEPSGRLEISGLKKPGADNPMISALEISYAGALSTAPTSTPTLAGSNVPSGEPSSFPTRVPTVYPSGSPSAGSTPVVKVNFGRNSETNGYQPPQAANLTGTISLYGGYNVDIDGTNDDDAYASHAWSSWKVGYKMVLDPSKLYNVRVGFAESYEPNCEIGARIFNLQVGTETIQDIDVFQAAGGCLTAYDMVFENVQPLQSSGVLQVAVFKGKKENAIISLLEVMQA